MDDNKLAAALLAGMQAMDKDDPWAFMDLTVEDDGRVWIETTGSIDLVDLARFVNAELSRPD